MSDTQFAISNESEKKPDVKTRSPFLRIFYIIAFFLFGVVNLLAWTAFLTNIGYFQSKLAENNSLFRIFESWFFMISTIIGLTGNILNLVIVNRCNHSILILSTFIAFLVGFVYITIIASLKVSATLFFVLFSVPAILNLCTPIMITGLYTDAGYLDFICFISLNAGQSFSGLLLAIIKLILVKYPITQSDGATVDTDKTAILYFSITIGMLVLSIFFYIILIFTPEYKKKKQAEKKSDTKVVHKPLKQQMIGYYSMFKRKWIDGITIYLTLTATLFIFPVLLLKVESTSTNEDWKKYFKDFNAFFAFALGDFISRYTYLIFKWPKPNTIWMIIVALSRFLFLFLFFLCPRGVDSIFPAIFNHDILPILFVFIFGLTNGHLITTVFSVPYSLDTREQQIDCSTLFVLLLGCGLASGSLLSWVF